MIVDSLSPRNIPLLEIGNSMDVLIIIFPQTMRQEGACCEIQDGSTHI